MIDTSICSTNEIQLGNMETRHGNIGELVREECERQGEGEEEGQL